VRGPGTEAATSTAIPIWRVAQAIASAVRSSSAGRRADARSPARSRSGPPRSTPRTTLLGSGCPNAGSEAPTRNPSAPTPRWQSGGSRPARQLPGTADGPASPRQGAGGRTWQAPAPPAPVGVRPDSRAAGRAQGARREPAGSPAGSRSAPGYIGAVADFHQLAREQRRPGRDRQHQQPDLDPGRQGQNLDQSQGR